MLVPAVVYLAMNLLSYVAIQRIDAGLFTVFAQCKVCVCVCVCARIMCWCQGEIERMCVCVRARKCAVCACARA